MSGFLRNIVIENVFYEYRLYARQVKYKCQNMHCLLFIQQSDVYFISIVIACKGIHKEFRSEYVRASFICNFFNEHLWTVTPYEMLVRKKIS